MTGSGNDTQFQSEAVPPKRGTRIKSALSIVRSPLARISFGLVMLSLSLLLVADAIGLIPDQRSNDLRYRQHIAVSLAERIANQLPDADAASLSPLLESMVAREEDLTGLGVRDAAGEILGATSLYAAEWKLGAEEQSSPEQIRIALLTRSGESGHIELLFKPLARNSTDLLRLAAYIGISGFIGFFIFLKRVLRELDPKQVMPDRVRNALDTLTDGVLILNTDGVVVFGNRSLGSKVGIQAGHLVGRDSNRFAWQIIDEERDLPWADALKHGRASEDRRLELRAGLNRIYRFSVNVSPIVGEGKDVRGALATFNDITEVEHKRLELEDTLRELEESEAEIKRKNDELYTLATLDPLTNVFNRRAFFEAFDTLFSEARNSGLVLGCIMVDIDHFKSVNDTHGHAVGDVVIRYLADILQKYAKSTDVVGRFGGEEFCVVLPAVTLEDTFARAEQIRIAIDSDEDSTFKELLTITASFGVSAIDELTETPKELVDQADQALYYAKENGRNRVGSWANGVATLPNGAAPADSVPAAPPREQPQPSTEPAEAATAAKREVAAGEELTVAADASAAPDDSRTKEPATAKQAEADGETVLASDTETETPLRRSSDRRKVSVKSVLQREGERGDSPGAQVLVETEPKVLGRKLLLHSIEQSLIKSKRDQTVLALLVFDCECLADIADSVSHEASTKLGAMLADRMKSQLRNRDVVSQGAFSSSGSASDATDVRDGEMAVVVSGIDVMGSVQGIVERLLKVYAQSFAIEGMEYVLHTSVGVSVFDTDGHDAHGLLEKASRACDVARQAVGESEYRFYSQKMDEAAQRIVRLDNDMRKAGNRGEFELHYQPKVDLLSGHIVGFEALLRWNHPEFGAVSPAEFIPLSERSGIVGDLNRWVLKSVCHQLREWKQHDIENVSVAVNLSAQELEDPRLLENIMGVMQRFEIEPSSLELELTESADIVSFEVARNMLIKLSRAGFKIAIDDFGTGYASLNYLQEFPIDRIKIDRSFVEQVNADHRKAQLVRSIIAMGKSLGMRVLAEGVETEDQLLFLRDHFCDEIQGYITSRPVPAIEATEMLRDTSLLSQVVLAADMRSTAIPSEAQESGYGGGMVASLFSHFPGGGADFLTADSAAANQPKSDSTGDSNEAQNNDSAATKNADRRSA